MTVSSHGSSPPEHAAWIKPAGTFRDFFSQSGVNTRHPGKTGVQVAETPATGHLLPLHTPQLGVVAPMVLGILGTVGDPGDHYHSSVTVNMLQNERDSYI